MYTAPMWIAKLTVKARVNLLRKAHSLVLDFVQRNPGVRRERLTECAEELWALAEWIERGKDDNHQ